MKRSADAAVIEMEATEVVNFVYVYSSDKKDVVTMSLTASMLALGTQLPLKFLITGNDLFKLGTKEREP